MSLFISRTISGCYGKRSTSPTGPQRRCPPSRLQSCHWRQQEETLQACCKSNPDQCDQLEIHFGQLLGKIGLLFILTSCHNDLDCYRAFLLKHMKRPF